MRTQLITLSLLVSLAGCGTAYVTPGRAAPMAALGATEVDQLRGADSAINDAMAKKPLASFPAAVAMVRVQSPEYRSRTATGWGTGRYSIVTSRDVESVADVEKLSSLPMLRGLAPLNR